MGVVRTENLTPFAANKRQDLEQGVTAALAELLGLGSDAVLEWKRQEPRPKGLGHLVLRLEVGSPSPLALDVRDDQEPKRFWMDRGGLFFDPRDNEDGSSPHHEPNQKDALARVRASLEASDFETKRDRLRGAMRDFVLWNDVDDGAFRQISWANGKPYGILRLSFRCNQDCSFCWQSRAWPSPPEEQYHQWLEEMAAANVDLMVFSGGEPTIFKGLPELIDRASREFGLRTQIQTNAIQLRRLDFARQLKDAGLREAFVSFHSADATISDKMTRAPGTHVHTVAGIKNAIDVGIKVHLNAVVERANYQGLEAQARFIVSEFVRGRFRKRPRLVTYSHPCHAYEKEQWDEAVVPLDDVRPYVVAAAAVLKQARVPIQVIGSCGFPPCLFRDAPHLISWVDRDKYDSGDTSGRVFPEPCDGCAVRDKCMGVRSEYIDQFGTRGLAPFEKAPKVGRWPLR